MDPDRFKGAAKEFGGKIEELAGNAVGHEDTRASGVGRQIEGMGQNLYGRPRTICATPANAPNRCSTIPAMSPARSGTKRSTNPAAPMTRRQGR